MFVLLADPVSVHTQRWFDGMRGRGYRVILVPSRESGRPGARKLVRWITRRLRLRRLMHRPNTVLMVQYIPAGIRASVLLGIHPRIGVAWGSDIYMTNRATVRMAIAAIQQSAFLRGCDAVIAPSRDLVRAAIDAGAHASQTNHVPFGVDLDVFRPGPDPLALRAKLGLDGYRVVLSNRTIAPIYNQATMVEALAQLDADVIVLMTSYLAQPSEVEAVVRRARELHVDDRVRILDRVDDDTVPELYRLADVVVSLAGSDGGPITILEAMACGRPIVATDLPGVREWLADLDPGALVPVADAAATAAAIRGALDLSPAERRALARRQRALVERRANRESAFDMAEALHRLLTTDHHLEDA
jgi:glycosyltransferase involved in cell wall biosynthesis